ncbi:DUF2730 family protein [Amaricoccus sp.]|uniref:DUF2730 family protein n=1 Tax=Amaricoccus sp. TaxID=1872485 RepID=UPI001B4F092F|nr:DUF2730 family protein [Amaricoccus sp.]MBP7242946.1 DUF2730 family protein [Amaricoccus sp.]
MNIPVDLTLSAGVIVTVLLAIIGWLQMRWGALSKRVDDQAARVEGHAARLTSAEAVIRTLPARDELHRIEVSLASMSGDMKTVSALLAGQRDLMQRMESVVARHEDHLLTKR